MRHKITLPQLKKYDVTQKVIESLADAESRAIVFSIVHKGKTAGDLSHALKIPLSSVYKKLSDLEYLTLIEIEKCVKGKPEDKYYREQKEKFQHSMKKGNPTSL